MTLDKDNSTGVLKISGTLDIDTANSLREALLNCFLVQSEVAVDLSAVDECDAAGLQVLLAGQRDAACLGKIFHVHGAPAAVSATAAALGLPVPGSAKTLNEDRPDAA